jgi:hypothetical protein
MDTCVYFKVTFEEREFQVLKQGNISTESSLLILHYIYIKLQMGHYLVAA